MWKNPVMLVIAHHLMNNKPLQPWVWDSCNWEMGSCIPQW